MCTFQMFIFTGRNFNYFILMQLDLFLCQAQMNQYFLAHHSYSLNNFYYYIKSEVLNRNTLNYSSLTIFIFILYIQHEHFFHPSWGTVFWTRICVLARNIKTYCGLKEYISLLLVKTSFPCTSSGPAGACSYATRFYLLEILFLTMVKWQPEDSPGFNIATEQNNTNVLQCVCGR